MRFVAALSLFVVLFGASLAEGQRRGSSFGSRSRSTTRSTTGSSLSGSRGSSGTRRSISPTRSTSRFGTSRSGSTRSRGTRRLGRREGFSSSTGGSSSRGVASAPQEYWNVSPRKAAIILISLLLLVGGVIWLIRRMSGPSEDRDPIPGVRPGPAPRSDVSALMIGFDARARSALQPQLDAMARGEVGWEQHQLLAGAVQLLAAHRDSWVYLGAMDAVPTDLGESERTFERFTADLRSRYRDEMVRGIDGRVESRQGAAVKPTRDEGAGLCVVSVVVEARDALADLRGVADPARMAAALDTFARIPPAELVAFEVIWSPADDADRMSSAELEVLYPELRPVGAAEVGRHECAHCGATYARELQWCPSCGAPPVLSPGWS